MDILDKSLAGRDPIFVILRDAPQHEVSRTFVRELWNQYRPYADHHFALEFRNNTYSRFWEMYLACAFLDAGFKLDSGDAGPDFFVVGGDRRIAIEAVAPDPDVGLASIQLDPHIGTRLPEEEIIRRYTGAILSKSKKFESDRQKLLVRSDDVAVIAINGIKIHNSVSFEDVPRVLKAVYPISHCDATFDPSGDLRVASIGERRELRTRNGAPISTDTFLTPQHEHVSAVLFSQVWPLDVNRPLGQDFVLAHNQEASSPLGHGLWRMGREYWYQGGCLAGLRWPIPGPS